MKVVFIVHLNINNWRYDLIVKYDTYDLCTRKENQRINESHHQEQITANNHEHIYKQSKYSFQYTSFVYLNTFSLKQSEHIKCQKYT